MGIDEYWKENKYIRSKNMSQIHARKTNMRKAPPPKYEPTPFQRERANAVRDGSADNLKSLDENLT